MQQSGQAGPRPNRNAVWCFRCQGWGHFSSQCPSHKSEQNRGERRGQYARGRRKQRARTKRPWSNVSECLPDRVRVRSVCTAATGARHCPSARATRAGKLTAPHHGQLCLLGARLECLGRHGPRAQQGGGSEGRPTKEYKKQKCCSKEEYIDVQRRKRNRARVERRRRAKKRLMAAQMEATTKL